MRNLRSYSIKCFSWFSKPGHTT